LRFGADPDFMHYPNGWSAANQICLEEGNWHLNIYQNSRNSLIGILPLLAELFAILRLDTAKIEFNCL
jgi:hypothetical protein